MIRTECTRLIKYLFGNGKINEEKKNKCLEYINHESTHKQVRDLIMMILLPKRLHFDGAHQAAFLRAAVSRVSKLVMIFNLLFLQIANQTVLEAEGLFFLRPVYELFFGDDSFFLQLPRSSVRVCYKSYYNTYKGIQIGPNDLSLDDAVNQGLTPGEA